MNKSQVRTWLALTGLTAVLMSLLVFLYVKAHGFNDLEYFENVAMFRQLKQLDAQWELDVFKARVGVNTSYDPLADSLRGIEALIGKMQEQAGAGRTSRAEVFGRGIELLRAAIRRKAALIEEFKSTNSLLRNSVTFLPVAADDVRGHFHNAGEAPGRVSPAVLADVERLLLSIMLYSQGATAERALQVESGLLRLEAGSRNMPQPVRERLGIFGAHVRTVLEKQRAVDNLVAFISSVPTAAGIDALEGALNTEQQEAARKNIEYRRYLLVISLAMVVLLVSAGFQLKRSYELVDQGNRKLRHLNENLEIRVQERTRELRQAQSELVDAARHAGMAEIASNVLHNVGNVLNSVNVSIDLLSSRVRRSRIDGVRRLTQLLDDHAGDLRESLTLDPKGKLIPEFLRELACALETEQREMLEELASVRKSLDHIKVIVTTQQSFAGSAGVIELANLDDLVEDALRIKGAALERDKVTVIKDLAAVPALPLDRHRVLQILVNLISNAQQSLEAAGRENPSITIAGDVSDAGRLKLAVSDNGEGIAAEDLTRIFSHGFTTRRNGHGFGLHSSILAAREMGGGLIAHSEGRGQGATFTLDLPTDMRPTV